MRRLCWPALALLVCLGCDDKKPEATAQETSESSSESSSSSTSTPSAPTKPKESKPEPSKPKAAHLTEAQAKPLAVKTLAGFNLKSFKIKPKTPEWHEIKMNYQSGQGTEVKLVINDWPPQGNPNWKTLILPTKEKTRGYASMLDEKPDKQTLMVLVGERYRVDFKTRNGKKEDLTKMAEAFDFKALEALK